MRKNYVSITLALLFYSILFAQNYPIHWDDETNLLKQGKILSSEANGWLSGGFSKNFLDIESDGFIETTIKETTTSRIIGFSNPNDSIAGNQFVNYGVLFDGEGKYYSIINGTISNDTIGDYSRNDVFKLEIKRTTNEVIVTRTYRKEVDNVLVEMTTPTIISTSTVPNQNFHIDIAMLDPGTTVYDLKSSFPAKYHVKWTDLTNVNIDNDTLISTVNSWNSAAASENILKPSENGIVRFPILDGQKESYTAGRMIGLSRDNYIDSNPNNPSPNNIYLSSVEYGFYITQTVWRYRKYTNGNLETFVGGGYEDGDVLEIQVERDQAKVYYNQYRDGTLIKQKESELNGNYSLIIDLAFFRAQSRLHAMTASFDSRKIMINSEQELRNLSDFDTAIIRKDITISGGNLQLPKEVSLVFENSNDTLMTKGKLIDNGHLFGDKTQIVVANDSLSEIFGSNDKMLKGTWNVHQVHPSWFYSTNATNHDNSLKKAFSVGGEIKLASSYDIDSRFDIPKNTYLIGLVNESTEQIDTNVNFVGTEKTLLFMEDKVFLEIENINLNNGRLIDIDNSNQIEDKDSYRLLINNNLININTNNTLSGAAVKTNYGGRKYIHFNTVEITNNIFQKTSVINVDHLTAKKITIEDNDFIDCKGYIFRAEGSKPRQNFDYISFKRNTVRNLTSSDAGAARILQANADDTIDFMNNDIDGVTAGGYAGNYVYWGSGNLNFSHNICNNISSPTAAIHDKGVDSIYTTIISHNVFDQANIPYLQLNSGAFTSNPKLGIINIKRAHNVTISDNEFKNLKTYALRVLGGEDDPATLASENPRNIIFKNNVIDSLNFKSTILFSQYVEDAIIENNCVSNLSNTEINLGEDPRFVQLSMSGSLGRIENITITKNTLFNLQSNTSLLQARILSTANCNQVEAIDIQNNEFSGGSTLVDIHFSTGPENLTIANNLYNFSVNNPVLTGTTPTCGTYTNSPNTSTDALISCTQQQNNQQSSNILGSNSKLNGIDEFKYYLSPNPSKDYFKIESINSTQSIKSIDVHDIMGNLIKHIDNIHSGRTTITSSSWASGIYFVSVYSEIENTRTTLKLIKE